jgi:hypothetical protein
MKAFYARKLEIRKKNNAFFLSMVLSIQFRGQFNRNGSDLMERLNNKLRHIFTFHANATRCVKEETAGAIIVAFLKRWNLVYLLQSKVLKLHKNLKMIVCRVENKYDII